MSLEIENLLEKFKNVKVLVVGDVMLDRYWWGSVTRISPEAPVPVVNLQKTTVAVGGAGNVAANIKGLNATPYLVGIIGNDEDGKNLKKSLEEANISSEYLFAVNDRPTIVKTRIVAQQQQIARIDQERVSNLTSADEEILWEKLSVLLEKVDIVVISDYDKGLLSEKLLMRLITTGKSLNKKILVDPKGKDYLKYKNATLLTPNRKEAIEASHKNKVNEAGNELMKKLTLDSLLITQGEDGMTIFQDNQENLHLPALARHVYDVTGAGDTVIATLAVALGSGEELVNSAKLANIAAGFVVEELGTTIITSDKLKQANI